jgi:aminoglycoside phosphotransferase (APT) family kinase protein
VATGLAHGDLHVRHLLVDEAGALAGVIDWGEVCRGHPASELEREARAGVERALRD